MSILLPFSIHSPPPPHFLAMPEILVVFSALVSVHENLCVSLAAAGLSTSLTAAQEDLATAENELRRVHADKDRMKGITRHVDMSKHVNRHAPMVKVIGWEVNKLGVTEYLVETTFGCGPDGSANTGGPVVTRHRYSDFELLHEQLGNSNLPFPVGKKWLHWGYVKTARGCKLEAYLANIVVASLKVWAGEVASVGNLRDGGDVFMAPLKEFLEAGDLEIGRLKGM